MTPDIVADYLVSYADDHGLEICPSLSIPRRAFIKYITEVLDMQADMYDINREFNADDREHIQEIMDLFIFACQHEDDFVITFDPEDGTYILDEP